MKQVGSWPQETSRGHQLPWPAVLGLISTTCFAYACCFSAAGAIGGKGSGWPNSGPSSCDLGCEGFSPKVEMLSNLFSFKVEDEIALND